MKQEDNFRHSLAHLLALSALRFDKKAQFGVGPVIENGFYYDIKFSKKVDESILEKLEATMREFIAQDIKIQGKKISIAEAKKIFKKLQQPFKLELIADLAKYGTTDVSEINQLKHSPAGSGQEKTKKKVSSSDPVSVYEAGEFVDLCRGGHVKHASEIPGFFKLTALGGAYWRGSEKNPMLTRIYGVAFSSQEKLEEYMRLQEEAQKRNHHVLGERFQLFTFFDKIGKGLPVWLPNGEIMRREIEALAISMEEKYGYVRVSTPVLAKKELFETSGHLPYYKDSMYPPMKMDDGEYYLKAMNCPSHHLIFKHTIRSYRELPFRIAEYGLCHRNELSGTLTGLQRVRSMNMNDAHIYCTKDQIEGEIASVLEMIKSYYEIFGLKEYWFRLSLSDAGHKEKYINQPKNWKLTEEILRGVLKKLKLPFTEAKDEAAFYGPKIDVQFKNVFGKEETMSTVQLDFSAKERFELFYIDEKGQHNKEVFVIHRAPLSTHERFMAFVIEHFGGDFPLWLSPVQAVVLPIGENQEKYAKDIVLKMKEEGIRVLYSIPDESLSKRIREAEKNRIPYVLVVGDKEIQAGVVSVRKRSEGDLGQKSVDAFIKEVAASRRDRR